MVGPRERPPAPNEGAPRVPPLGELEQWLRASEARVAPVPGTEKRIVWHLEPGARTPWALVYVHGFSASRQELAPVPRRLADTLGANLFEARLTGHGAGGAALGASTAADWVHDVREAVEIGRRIGRRVVLLGCSTGATLDAYLSAYGVIEPDVHVWISPNFGPQSAAAELLLWPWARQWVPAVAGDERTWEPVNEEQGKYWTTRYPVDALFGMQALVEGARSAPIEGIHAPVLVVHSRDDPVIRPGAVVEAYERLGSANKHRLEMSGARDPHVLAGEIMSPGRTERVVEEVSAWLSSVVAP